MSFRTRGSSAELHGSQGRLDTGFVVLSRDPVVRGEVVDAGATAGRLYLVANDADELLALLEATHPAAVIIDRDHASCDDVLRRLTALPSRDQTAVILVIRDANDDPPRGAHVLAVDSALRHVLPIVDRSAMFEIARRPLGIDRLLTLSVVSGPLDEALASAADQVAAGFGVERCLISVRGDSTGGVAVGAHTWDSLAWAQTTQRCRAAAAASATLIAPTARSCESYLAVPLETPLGSHGFIGLVVGRARVFQRADRVALQAVATRLAIDLNWRGVHERTSDDLDRAMNGPGLDPRLGVWNRIAMTRLIATEVSAALRTNQPLASVVIDIVDLAGINTRYGLDTGDRVLQRIADAVRTTVRTEDLVGRWAGDKLALVLRGTELEGAARLVERLKAALAARPLDLPTGGVLPIPVTIGLASLQQSEDAARFMSRAVWAAGKADEGGHAVAGASTGPSPRLSQQVEVGDELRALGDTYRLLHEISRGGMGVVYRAEDLALERPVAIKMLRPDLAEDRIFVEHLRSEAAMLARLQHPNLVQIYNFGQTGGDSYFVMELVEGEGMQQAIDRHRLEGSTMPLAEVIVVIEQIASALDALHDRGIVHRDVKPANIIRDPFRARSVLVDVGIARRYGQFVESAGTPGFVAPEVIAGQEAGPRSDVYGLASTAYTMLTLSPPWGDDAVGGILARQCSDDAPAAPSTHWAELAPADQILLAALHRDPTQRPASAGVFARALAEALAPLSAASKDVSRWAGNVVLPNRAGRAVARTRGVVFRAVTRALGIREAERLRDALGGSHPDLARALTETAPLAWLPTEQFTRLLAIAPDHVHRESTVLARDVARATVRASFRRFFPASAATLVPDRTLSAIRNVWSRYQTWGAVSCMPVRPAEMVVRIADTPREPDLCAWVSGMLEQLVVLSGGRAVTVDHEACEARGDDVCLYRVMWERSG